jgi:hypothetical protein
MAPRTVSRVRLVMGKDKATALVIAAPPTTPARVLSAEQAADVELRLGDRAAIRLSARMTPAGLLAVGGMVWGILLSSAVIVRAAGAARREGGR